jgi:hypothetical protein
MNRKDFLGMIVGGVATMAAVRAWPFRVYSFPSKPLLMKGDVIMPYSKYFDIGQMVAAYSSDGKLCRGFYRITKIEAESGQIYLAYEES